MLLAWVTVIAVAFTQPARLHAQVTAQSRVTAESEDPSWHFHYDLLQMLLEERGLEMLPDLNAALRTPSQSVIAIVGDRPALSNQQWSELISFIIDGGTLLLATDSAFNVPGVGKFYSGPVSTRDPDEQYQGFEDCIRVRPQPDSTALEGVSAMITNRSGWFVPHTVGWFQWEEVAKLPSDCIPLAARSAALMSIGRWGADGAGQVIVVADSSVFSNGMLWHGDNAVAAIRVSELLTAKPKSQLAFISDGQLLDSYRNRIPEEDPSGNEDPMENRPKPEPEFKKMLRLANAIVKDVAESNVINEALRERPRNVQPSNYFRAILYLIAASLLLGTVALILRSSALQGFFLPPRIMRSAYEMRENANGYADDFRTSAGFLARELCFELTESRNSADWQKFLAETVYKATKLSNAERMELGRIIDIACRGCHVRMTRHEFQLLGKSISILRAKYRQGEMLG